MTMGAKYVRDKAGGVGRANGTLSYASPTPPDTGARLIRFRFLRIPAARGDNNEHAVDFNGPGFYPRRG